MGSDVTLQVKGVVEALVTVAALVLLVGRVVSPMSVQHSDVFETFSTNFTLVLSRRSARCLEIMVRHSAKIFFIIFWIILCGVLLTISGLYIVITKQRLAEKQRINRFSKQRKKKVFLDSLVRISDSEFMFLDSSYRINESKKVVS